MRFSIARQSLEKAIQRVLAVVSPKTTLPILANFLLEADQKAGVVSITATDLDMTVTTKIEANVEAGGGITLPAKRFSEIVRALGDADVTVSVDGEEISIKSGKGKFRIVGIPTEEFPKLPESDLSAAFDVDAELLVRMVDKVSFCISRDETRPSLNGAFWEFTAKAMGMTATDGHRLATFNVAGDFSKLEGKDVIVPPKALAHATRIIGAEGDETVKVAVQENHVVFFVGDTIINSRLLEGPFPNYHQVIPKDNEKNLMVGRAELASAVKRVAVLSDALTHQVKLVLSKKKIELAVSTPDVGEAKEEIAAKFDSEKMEVGYNANYLLDVLKHLDGDNAHFVLGSPVGAAVVSTAEPVEGEEHLCLLMPLRLST